MLFLYHLFFKKSRFFLRFRQGKWPTSLEVAALATLLNVNIVIYSTRHPDDPSRFVPVTDKKTDKKTGDTITIGYVDGLCYVMLKPLIAGKLKLMRKGSGYGWVRVFNTENNEGQGQIVKFEGQQGQVLKPKYKGQGQNPRGILKRF